MPIEIETLFTNADLQLADQIVTAAEQRGESANSALLASVVTHEKMQEINAITGQENDPRYIAYLLEYVRYHEDGHD